MGRGVERPWWTINWVAWQRDHPKWTFGQRHRRALVHLEELESAERAERTLSGYYENVEALPYRCMWLWGETDYVSSRWPQIWHTSADPSGNGYTPNKLPLETQSLGGGGFRGQTFKSLEKLSNGRTDWHQLWFTSADSSGNGLRLNPSRPSIPQGHFGGGGLGGHTFKCLVKLSNGWTDWHPVCYKSADSSGNRHRLNTICPTIPHGGILGGFRGQQFKSLGNLVKHRFGINFAYVMQVNLGMDTGWINWPHETPGGAFWRGVK